MKATQPCAPTRHLDLESRDLLIRFGEGLIGFPECKDFVLKETDDRAPFFLLQALQLPELCFLVLEPTVVIPNYYDLVPAREWESVGVDATVKPRAFVIIVIGSGLVSSTGNFQAPLLINQETMTGRQVILTDSGLSVRQLL